MANEQNLIPGAHTLTVEEASKGGTNSGKARREARTIQNILKDFLDLPIESNEKAAEFAQKLGLTSANSIKELCSLSFLLNSLSDGNLNDLGKLSDLIGEKPKAEESESGEFDLSSVTVMPIDRYDGVFSSLSLALGHCLAVACGALRSAPQGAYRALGGRQGLLPALPQHDGDCARLRGTARGFLRRI